MKSFVFLLLITTSSFLFAQNKSDGNAWHQICNSKSTELMCGGYIAGFIAGVGTQAEVFKTEKLFCMPANATTAQATDVFSRYLQIHPEKRHLHSSTLASIALIEAFPCK